MAPAALGPPGQTGVIHLAGPVVLASVLAGAGVYGLVARRNAVLVLVGAELLRRRRRACCS